MHHNTKWENSPRIHAFSAALGKSVEIVNSAPRGEGTSNEAMNLLHRNQQRKLNKMTPCEHSEVPTRVTEESYTPEPL